MATGLEPRLPVTLIAGLADADKTALVRHILARPGVLRIHAVRQTAEGAYGQPGDDLAGDWARVAQQLPDAGGGLSCALRGDLLAHVRRAVGKAHALLVELPGGVEPQAAAGALAGPDDDGTAVDALARVDTVVTVVDATRLFADVQSDELLLDRRLALGRNDDRSLAEVAIAQIEHADVVVVARWERVPARAAARAEALLRVLNPSARLVRAQHGRVSPALVVATGRHDPDRSPAGWAAALAGFDLPEGREGVSHLTYRRRRPFHPQRLSEALADPFDGLIRSKGFVWLASRPWLALLWDQAGPVLTLERAGTWMADRPVSAWAALDPFERLELEAAWDPYYGDRQQELVFIGADMDTAAIASALDACLLTDAELSMGQPGWRELPDPFPHWEADACAPPPSPKGRR
ncbi:MAG: CobW family GTP-binding protein [Egibacteraceae bacterium]